MIITDLDHTMLGRGLKADGIPETLDLLKIAGIRVVPNTAKTLEEVHLVWTRVLQRRPPELVAFENSSAIASPTNTLPYADYRVEIEGQVYHVLELSIRLEEYSREAYNIARDACPHVRRIEELSDEILVELTGIPVDHARAAKKRRYDLVLWAADKNCLSRAGETLESTGYTTVLGANFLHVITHPGKRQAVEWVRANRHLLGAWTRIVALGDAPVDKGMLEVSDIPIVVPRDGVRVRPRASYLIAPCQAPHGWVKIVRELLINGSIFK